MIFKIEAVYFWCQRIFSEIHNSRFLENSSSFAVWHHKERLFRCLCPTPPLLGTDLLLGHVTLYILQLFHTLGRKMTRVIASQQQTVYCLFPGPDILFPRDISVKTYFSKVRKETNKITYTLKRNL